MRKTYYATQKMLDVISDMLDIMDGIENKITNEEEMCDNNCRNKKGERCPFNIHKDVCSLDRISNDLSEVYNIVEKELVIRSREESD